MQNSLSALALASTPPSDGGEHSRPLGSLSDDELLAGLRAIVFQSHRLLARLIAFLVELDRRELWAKHASSLFDFCVRCLGFAEDAAYRRITVVRLASRFPEIIGRIERGEIHLSGLLLLKDHLTLINHEELLDAATHKTKRQIEIEIAKHSLRPDVEDSIRPARTDEHDRTAPEPLSPERFRVEFTASTNFCEKMQHARDLMSHANPRGEIAMVLERALDLLIPKLEYERFGKTRTPRDADPTTVIANGDGIPAAMKHAVAERDAYRCTFCSEDGHRCEAKSFLEFDHLIPKACGGPTTVENLRLRCRTHNRLAAVEVFGREHVQEKLAERKAATEPAPARSAERELLKSVESALVNLGYQPKEALEAVETIAAAHDATVPASFDALLREALAFLTPSDTERRKRNEEPSAMLKSVEAALVRLGFKKKEAVAALETVALRIDPSKWSIQSLLRESLAFLTPPAFVTKPEVAPRQPEASARPNIAPSSEEQSAPPP